MDFLIYTTISKNNCQLIQSVTNYIVYSWFIFLIETCRLVIGNQKFREGSEVLKPEIPKLYILFNCDNENFISISISNILPTFDTIINSQRNISKS